MIEERKWCVYKHTNKINNKVYIGTSSNVKRRWGNGGQGYKAQHPYFYEDIKKYDWNNFEHEIIESNLTESDSKKLEMSTISQYPKSELYNKTDGGDGSFGYKVSEETRKKMCESQQKVGRAGGKFPCRKSPTQKIKKQPVFKTHEQKPVSKGTREKMSKAGLGKKYTEETKKKISEALTGIVRSQETREKLREAWKTRTVPKESIEKMAKANRKPVYQINIKTNEIIQEFSSVVEASEKFKIDAAGISKVCNNKKRNMAGGFKWEYKNK